MKPQANSITMRSEPMPVGDGFAVSFSFVRGRLDAEWTPTVPSNRPHLAPAYQRARSEFMRRLAKRIGGAVLVVDA